MRFSQNLLHEMFREMTEDRIQSKVVDMSVFCSAVVIEIYEILNVIVRAYVFYVLFCSYNGDTNNLVSYDSDIRPQLSAILQIQNIDITKIL